MTGEQVMGAWLDAYNRRDAEAFAPLYHPDAVNHQVAAGDPVVGRETILSNIRAFFRAFPDNYTHRVAMHTAGEWVMVEWSGGGTWLGEFLGREPTGRSYTLCGCGFFRIQDGQIVFQRGYWDRAGWFLQLGIPVG